MKSILLAFVGVCAAWVTTTGDPPAQAILGATAMDAPGGRPPVSGVALPAVTWKPIQVSGVDCERSLSRGQGLLIKR